MTPDIHTSHGMPYALDNGAWGCFQRGEGFSADGFEALVDQYGEGADWVVVPDIVMGGPNSLAFSIDWLPWVAARAAVALIAVQDEMTADDLAPLVSSSVGIFVGGSTTWKEQSLPMWGRLAAESGCYLHVGRVNSKRRIKLCALAGADSFDGTSATIFSVNAGKLAAAARQQTLWSAGEV